MISGSLPILFAALTAALPPEAAALVARLARPAPASTAYLEVRFVHLLRAPLVLRGELDYRGAERLGKRVDSPYRELTTIADGTVTVERAGRAPHRFAIGRVPELEALLAGFGALLGGDAGRLDAGYTVDIVENTQNWTLTLRPRAAALAARVRALVVDGSDAEPRCFALYEADGDADVLLLGAAAAVEPPPRTRAEVEAHCRRLAP